MPYDMAMHHHHLYVLFISNILKVSCSWEDGWLVALMPLTTFQVSSSFGAAATTTNNQAQQTISFKKMQNFAKHLWFWRFRHFRREFSILGGSRRSCCCRSLCRQASAQSIPLRQPLPLPQPYLVRWSMISWLCRKLLLWGNVLLVDSTSRDQLWEVVVNQGVVDSVISEQFFNWFRQRIFVLVKGHA